MRQEGSPTQLDLKRHMEEHTFQKIIEIAEFFKKSTGTIRKRFKIAVDDYEVPYLETRLGYILLRPGVEMEINLAEYIILIQAARRQKGIFLHYYHAIRATNPKIKQMDVHFELEEPQQIDTDQTLKFLKDTTECIERSAKQSEVILIKKYQTAKNRGS